MLLFVIPATSNCHTGEGRYPDKSNYFFGYHACAWYDNPFFWYDNAFVWYDYAFAYQDNESYNAVIPRAGVVSRLINRP